MTSYADINLQHVIYVLTVSTLPEQVRNGV